MGRKDGALSGSLFLFLAGQRLKEGGHINKSLLALGSVIAKLSEGERYGIYQGFAVVSPDDTPISIKVAPVNHVS